MTTEQQDKVNTLLLLVSRHATLAGELKDTTFNRDGDVFTGESRDIHRQFEAGIAFEQIKGSASGDRTLEKLVQVSVEASERGEVLRRIHDELLSISGSRAFDRVPFAGIH